VQVRRLLLAPLLLALLPVAMVVLQQHSLCMHANGQRVHGMANPQVWQSI
jgi:hypothetical protein